MTVAVALVIIEGVEDMSGKRVDLNLVSDISSAEELGSQELGVLQEIAQAVSEVIAKSPFPDIDADTYFIWMYSVEPFAEA